MPPIITALVVPNSSSSFGYRYPRQPISSPNAPKENINVDAITDKGNKNNNSFGIPRLFNCEKSNVLGNIA